jgi:hypothetical protein
MSLTRATFTIALFMLSAYAVAAQDASRPVKLREWGEQGGSFQLSISTDKTQYEPGEAIQLTAVLRNATNETARFEMTHRMTFFDMVVVLPGPDWIPLKRRAALTPFGERQRNPVVGGGFSVPPTQPGWQLSLDYEMNKLYDMSMPGTYHVTFSCMVPSMRWSDPKIRVTSNEIAITMPGKAERH